MRTIHKILIEVKTNYLRNIKFYGKWCHGLCNASDHASITYEERLLFNEYLQNAFKNRKVFYDYKGIKTPERYQFVWKKENQESRIKWLNKHIKNNEQ